MMIRQKAIRAIGVGLIFGLSMQCLRHSHPTLNRILQSLDQNEFLEQVSNAKSLINNVERIPIDPNSAMSNDIFSITHHPIHRRITVTLKPDAKCPRPYLLGRLSGRALIKLRWEQNHNLLKGYYDVPFTGPFFLEIIVISCNTDVDNVENCLVPGEEHRLTSQGASINAQISSRLPGYWISGATTIMTQVPLFTRFQPQNCRGDNSDLDRCREYTLMNPFKRYNRFVIDDPRIMARLDAINFMSDWKVISKNQADCYNDGDERGCNICTVGASHSSRLHRFLVSAAEVERVGNVVIHYPEELNQTKADEIMGQCRHIVIGFGQWSAAFPKTIPKEFGVSMHDTLSLFKEHESVHVRSVHYNPLGDEKLTCPPKDARNPPFLDGYNNAVQAVCEDHGVSWIDTRFIDEPVWDSGHDWNHLYWWPEIVQAVFIAERFGL